MTYEDTSIPGENAFLLRYERVQCGWSVLDASVRETFDTVNLVEHRSIPPVLKAGEIHSTV
ncbi:hypothetical protein GB937_001213 [Aspergillus fischeri]|nr:hypothetical protein GB937_001213 [Aspergillus fischeri]